MRRYGEKEERRVAWNVIDFWSHGNAEFARRKRLFQLFFVVRQDCHLLSFFLFFYRVHWFPPFFQRNFLGPFSIFHGEVKEIK